MKSNKQEKFRLKDFTIPILAILLIISFFLYGNYWDYINDGSMGKNLWDVQIELTKSCDFTGCAVGDNILITDWIYIDINVYNPALVKLKNLTISYKIYNFNTTDDFGRYIPINSEIIKDKWDGFLLQNINLNSKENVRLEIDVPNKDSKKYLLIIEIHQNRNSFNYVVSEQFLIIIGELS